MIWYALAVVSSFAASLGQVNLKLFGVKGKSFSLTAITDIHFVLSVALFFCSFGLGVWVMRHIDFSVYYAFTSLNYLFINILSARMLGEQIDSRKTIGILIIISGLIVFNL